MNENGEPAISDIGISGQFYVTERSMIYLAPEVLKSFDNMKKEADIYSFSILLWEMWHGDKAFEELRPIKTDDFKLKIINGYRPKLDKVMNYPHIKKMIETCWHHDPHQRPSIQQCLERLQEKTFMSANL